MCDVFDKSSRTILYAFKIKEDENIVHVTIGKIDEHNTLIESPDDVKWF